MEYLIISDIPTPWREPVFQRVYERLGGKVKVVYFRDNEKRRLWTFRMGTHPRTILRGISAGTATEHFVNPGIVPLLLRWRPHTALIFGGMKDPSTWLALGMCRLLGTKVALLSDSWLGRERGIGPVHRWARRVVFTRMADAFVGASRRTLEMYRHYNPAIVDEQCFLSHLVADNDYFEQQLASRCPERRFDVMFSGRLVALKNPVFFAKVCAGIKARLGGCRVLVIGEGDADLKAQMRGIFQQHGVSAVFAGFIPHAELPEYYAQSRLLLLPTSRDCWGVVINEAMIAGTPVITTEWTAAAGELVLDKRNGYVLPLDVDAWVSAATRLLSCQSDWRVFSQCSHDTVKQFNYDRAACGVVDAFTYLSGSV